jgi:hypothetical protein
LWINGLVGFLEELRDTARPSCAAAARGALPMKYRFLIALAIAATTLSGTAQTRIWRCGSKREKASFIPEYGALNYHKSNN